MKRRRRKAIQIPFKTWTATVEITAEEIEEAQKDPEKFIKRLVQIKLAEIEMYLNRVGPVTDWIFKNIVKSN